MYDLEHTHAVSVGVAVGKGIRQLSVGGEWLTHEVYGRCCSQPDPKVTIFRRFGKTDNGELASGVLPIGPWEIARLDNDPAFQENGVLRITPGGAK